MKKVYICSPLRGDYDTNIDNAIEYSRAVIQKGVIPVTPQIYFTRFMNDNITEERELALRIGRELVAECSELWAFGIYEPSEGMKGEIEEAMRLGIPVRDGFVAIGKTIHSAVVDGHQYDAVLIAGSIMP